MILLKRSLQLASALLLAFSAGVSAAQPADATIRIGVPMPLSGPLAQGGRMILAGIQFATDEANKNGGVLGKKIELLIEDTKSEPNTAAITAVKMANQDKVFAFAGGYGSTADFAMLQSLKRSKPIFVHMASSSVKIEETFGAEPWYFHVYIVDYHRQKAATAFFNAMTPRPKRIAIAYEDGLYGTDAVRSSEQYLKDGGFELVMKEPFKAGSPDFSSILNRVKSLDPDVFYVVGYSGDSIQMARQVDSLGVNPKLMLIVASGEKREDFGAAGENLAVIGEWARQQKTEGLPAFIERITPALPAGTPVLPTIVQGYTGMRTLIESIEAAGELNREKVLAQLSSRTFDSPYGKVAYGASERGGKHQLLTDENLIVWQYGKTGQEVVWPDNKASGKLTYPAH